jgi:hypothetical protein
MKFRKRPVMIDAIQWVGDNLFDVIEFIHARPDIKGNFAGMMWEQYEELVKREGLKIETLEGKMSASVGDWVIRGVKGEHYACKPDIFEMTYEAATAQEGKDEH